MNRSIIYTLFLSIIGFLSSCSTTSSDPTPTNVLTQATIDKITAYGTSKGLTFTRTPEDIFYALTKTNATGRKPLESEYCKVHYTITKLDGTIVDSTAIVRNIPYSFLYSSASNSLARYTASFMKEGEVAIFVFPTTSNSTDPISMNVTLLSTRNETEQISEYVQTSFKGISFKTTASGLKYVLTKISASGDTVKIGKTATVSYAGKFLYQSKSADSNGFPIYTDKFDSGSFSLIVGTGAVVPGFEEAAKLMKTGDKGIFILPSELGYKSVGRGTIAPYTPLLFEMEVTAVK